ncbi:MAG: shikimate dehydrogenase [Notoacmeibacter sp.]|nr:shikimate dehydrogenase [Notoacmeibacter sp.]MCC0033521.1 shikimate dehydrogenase [Brucellaceae bacterium]
MTDLLRAAVIGDPVKHSRSPLIHGHWLKLHGIAGRYDAIHVPAGRAPAFFEGLATSGLAGCNVTVPHKEDAFRAMDFRTATAEAIGAVNTVWLEDGRLHGDNTDAYGFLANLDERAPGWDRGGKAAVIGAGGAGRAIVHALLQRGFDRVDIVNRTAARATELASHFGGKVTGASLDQLNDALSGSALIVNTTTLGMEGSDGDVIDLTAAPRDALATDIVYTPLVTPFLASARERGMRTADGLGMLLHQAVPGFERWFGIRPEVTPNLRALVLADMGLEDAA